MNVMRFLTVLLLLLLSSRLCSAESQVMVATWELKQQVRQLRQDIALQQGSVTRLLDRCSQMLQEHPNHLVQDQQRFISIQQVLMQDLEQRQLLEAWQQHVENLASEAFTRAGHKEEALLRVAQSYPRTRYAQTAWQRLADMAWDQGHIGSYLYYAHHGSEVDNPERTGRMQAAQMLLNQQVKRVVPEELDRVDGIWTIDLPAFQPRNRGNDRRLRRAVINRRNQAQEGPVPYRISDGQEHILALSNGINMIIIDPLLGRQLGQVHHVGHNLYGMQSNRPYISDELVIALGAGNDGLSLVACNRLGRQQWRSLLPNTMSVSFASRPVVLDDKIFIATIQYASSSERIELFSLDLQGRLLARRTIAQITGGRPRFNQYVQDMSPDLCVHRGHLALLSNRGVIAQISSDGHILSLDTYPVRQLDMRFVRQFDNNDTTTRTRSAGVIRSGGSWLAAAPIDSNALLVSDKLNQGFHAYTGDGQDATLLDVTDRHVLILDDNKLRLIEAETRNLLWSHDRPPGNNAEAWGRIGSRHCLAAAGKRIALHDLKDGRLVSHIGYPEKQRVVMHDELLLFLSAQSLSGRGDSAQFEERLLADAKAAPGDFQPRIQLAALRRAQGRSLEAFNYLLRAIALGAPNSYSEDAAQIIRPHLFLHLNTQEFSTYADLLQRLTEFNQDFAQELIWWQARRAEFENDQERAIALYRSIEEGEAQVLSLSNNLRADLNTIASASIRRLEQQAAPWALPRDHEIVNDFAFERIAGSAPIKPLTQGPYIIGFINSFLRCIDARTGAEIWKQDTTGALPMLGVTRSMVPGEQTSTRIQVLKGMCADLIGIQHNDSIIGFNEHSINQWNDIIKAVADTKCGDTFTIQVKRGDDTHTFEGVLGSRPMQATQSNKHSVLCHNVNIVTDRRRPGMYTTTPDRANTPFVEIYDLESGRLLWHHDLATGAQVPLLTSNDLLIESIKGDLVARDVRNPDHPIRWTARGRGHELQDYQINDNVLIAIDHNVSRAVLRDLQSGKLLFSMPADPDYECMLIGDYFISTLPDKHLALWQLSTAEMLWTSQETLLKPLAASEHVIYCRTNNDEFISIDRTNGLIHRRYPQWTQVYAHKANASTLFLACINKNQEHTLSGIHLESGNVLWQHSLSSGLEFRDISLTSASGAYFELSSNDNRNGLVEMLNDGTCHQFVPLSEFSAFSQLGQQLVVSGEDGLYVTKGSPAAKNRTLKMHTIQRSGETYRDFINKHLDELQWTTLAENEYAVLRDGDQLHIVCRFTDPNQRMRLRLGFAGPLFDNNSALLLMKARFPISLHNAAGWQLTDQCQLADSEGQTIRACALELPPLRPDTRAILLHADQWQSTAPDIWWLRHYWYRLVE